MKKILLFGAGKSASVLIDYLIYESVENNWEIMVADANAELIEQKTMNRPHSKNILLDINDNAKRNSLIQEADIVISMMPPALHILIAHDCIEFGKSLLTASYADDTIKSLNAQAKEKGLIFLCEMGLDPGIDHMSAMKLLDEIKNKGGKITSFKSHCGGLVAPESDDNPWHYKISWNPRNVVLAGKAGAIYKDKGQVKKESYEELFSKDRTVVLKNENNEIFSFYPNRNSLPYIDLYHLEEADTFVRTTLRHRDFMNGWNLLVKNNLTDETANYDSKGKSLQDFFHQYLNVEENAEDLNPIFLNQLEFLGFNDAETIINKGICSPADVLQLALENKLILSKDDKDMIVMLHEVEYSINGNNHSVDSSLVVKGEDQIHTAMAKTVGLPLGIAAKLILNNTIKSNGVQIPVTKEIYEPVLSELIKYGIEFKETFV